jgi:hypothetical protein
MTSAELAYKLSKPFAILVTINDQQTTKEFDTEAEVISFAAELKKKLPDATADFIRRKERKKGREGQADSLGFQMVRELKSGNPMLDAFGRIIYKPIPVPARRGFLFCTICHDYKKFSTQYNSYGLDYQGCPDCKVSINDFDVKTCNQLWERAK